MQQGCAPTHKNRAQWVASRSGCPRGLCFFFFFASAEEALTAALQMQLQQVYLQLRGGGSQGESVPVSLRWVCDAPRGKYARTTTVYTTRGKAVVNPLWVVEKELGASIGVCEPPRER